MAALWQHEILRWLAIVSVISNFFGWFYGAVYALYAIRTLGLDIRTMQVEVTIGVQNVVRELSVETDASAAASAEEASVHIVRDRDMRDRKSVV